MHGLDVAEAIEGIMPIASASGSTVSSRTTLKITLAV